MFLPREFSVAHTGWTFMQTLEIHANPGYSCKTQASPRAFMRVGESMLAAVSVSVDGVPSGALGGCQGQREDQGEDQGPNQDHHTDSAQRTETKTKTRPQPITITWICSSARNAQSTETKAKTKDSTKDYHTASMVK